jgi:hypothetical protein
LGTPGHACSLDGMASVDVFRSNNTLTDCNRSMIFFIFCILSFVWRTGSTNDPSDPPGRVPLSPHAALGARITITALFSLGLLYFAMIVHTLRRYGSAVGKRERGREIGLETRMNGPSGNAVPAGRANEWDAEMERRGRERERNGSRNERKRKDLADGGDEKEGSGSRRMVGLGLQVGSKSPEGRNEPAGDCSEGDRGIGTR